MVAEFVAVTQLQHRGTVQEMTTARLRMNLQQIFALMGPTQLYLSNWTQGERKGGGGVVLKSPHFSGIPLVGAHDEGPKHKDMGAKPLQIF